MDSNGVDIMGVDPVADALQKLSELEKDFAAVELDAMRQKEFSSRELYSKRSTLTSLIPNFWSEILTSGAVPAEFGAVLSPLDGEILSHVKSINVERYQIISDTEGEPRSLRFTFEFEENKYFSDTAVVKDFEYRASDNGPGGFISKPVNFTWSKSAKKQGINTLLDLAEQLYLAEKALVQKGEIEQKEREGLWQYEKLREALEKAELEDVEEDDKRSFLEWFGYRGAVNAVESKAKPANGTSHSNGDSMEEDEDEDSDDEDDGVLDVEIFPAGEDVAIALAEDLWPNIMDYFIQATTDSIDDDDSNGDEEEEEDAPELVAAADFDGFDEDEEEVATAHPKKKRKTSS